MTRGGASKMRLPRAANDTPASRASPNSLTRPGCICGQGENRSPPGPAPPRLAMLLPSEPPTASSEAAHHFIGDQVDPSLPGPASDGRPEIFRCDDSVGAGVNLEHHGSDVSSVLCVDCGGDLLGRPGAAFL